MSSQAKNILWIYADELRADALSCYGGPAGLTPNLDRIAKEGVLFDQCWCSSPVCVPSRTSAVTALPATQTGIYHNEAAWKDFGWSNPPTSWIETLAEYGYRTVNVGKLHLPRGYQPFQEHYPANGDMRCILGRFDARELDLVYPPGVKTSIGGCWPKGESFPPEQTTMVCQNILREKQSQPLFLRVSYLQPHTPVTPPEELLEQWADLEPDNRYDHVKGPSVFEQKMAHNLKSDEFAPELARRCWQSYHALVHWLDIQVGKLMDTLEEQELLDNTLVLVTADHGASLGEKGLWAKQSFSPGSQRVPLIIRAPGSTRCGIRNNDLCSGLGLARTFFGWANIPAQETWHGRNLLTETGPEAVYSVIGYGTASSAQFPNLGYGSWSADKGWPRRACVRMKGWRYDRNIRMNGTLVAAEHPDADPCLIQMSHDPDELINVYSVYPEQAAHMEALLGSWIQDAVENQVWPR